MESLNGTQCSCYIVYVGATGATGAKGDKGEPGVGIADISLTSRNDNIDTYTITLTDGRTTTFTVTNSDKIEPGEGIKSIELTARNGSVTTYTVTLDDGSTYSYDINDVTGSAYVGGGTVIYVNDIAEGDYIIYTAVDDRMCLDIDGSAGGVNSDDNLHIWSADGAA